MGEIRNSLICVDQKGNVGIVSELGGSSAVFYPFDADGNTGEPVQTPIADLTQATMEQIPASRALPPAQAAELGYTSGAKAAAVVVNVDVPTRFTRIE